MNEGEDLAILIQSINIKSVVKFTNTNRNGNAKANANAITELCGSPVDGIRIEEKPQCVLYEQTKASVKLCRGRNLRDILTSIESRESSTSSPRRLSSSQSSSASTSVYLAATITQKKKIQAYDAKSRSSTYGISHRNMVVITRPAATMRRSANKFLDFIEDHLHGSFHTPSIGTEH
ncbi:uncharacterized protein LOC141527647 [Cotesia typhae]|uniref:uncharacterized protein LOC141527647 n=1 Tax=Cotesia typhae TaxID=2053667 RepID=UPI003D68011A